MTSRNIIVNTPTFYLARVVVAPNVTIFHYSIFAHFAATDPKIEVRVDVCVVECCFSSRSKRRKESGIKIRQGRKRSNSWKAHLVILNENDHLKLSFFFFFSLVTSSLLQQCIKHDKCQIDNLAISQAPVKLNNKTSWAFWGTLNATDWMSVCWSFSWAQTNMLQESELQL